MFDDNAFFVVFWRHLLFRSCFLMFDEQNKKNVKNRWKLESSSFANFWQLKPNTQPNLPKKVNYFFLKVQTKNRN